MRLSSNIEISPIREGFNILKAWISVITGRMISRPVSINLLPTMACNSRCIMCDSWMIKEKDPKLELDIYFKLAQEMKSMGIPYITIGGGEPLLYKDVVSLIKIFSSVGISVQLTTNGHNLTVQNCDEFVNAGLSRLTFSIDSHIPEIYKEQRGVDWCDEVTKLLCDFTKRYKNNLSIETNSVITEKNIDTFIDTVNFFLKVNTNKICFSLVTISGDNYLMNKDKHDLVKINEDKTKKLVNDLMLLKQKHPKQIAASSQFIKGAIKYIQNPKEAVFPCYAGFMTLDILYEGSVYSCGNLQTLGNIKGNTLREIWFSKEAMKSRLAMARKNCPACYTSCKIELGLLGNPIKGIPYCIEKLREAL